VESETAPELQCDSEPVVYAVRAGKVRQYNRFLTMNHLTHFALLGLAGAAGTLLRAGCTTLATRLFGVGFPWGTLAMNVVGSLVFGLIVGLARTRGTIGVSAETILLVGLLGGFTTFSSYAFQSVELLEGGRPLTAAAYVVGTNVAALGAVWAGLRIAGG
jgi:fluoride exporter